MALNTSIVWKRVRDLGYRLIYGLEEYEGKRQAAEKVATGVADPS